jgi:hypothetical protein
LFNGVAWLDEASAQSGRILPTARVDFEPVGRKAQCLRALGSGGAVTGCATADRIRGRVSYEPLADSACGAILALSQI